LGSGQPGTITTERPASDVVGEPLALPSARLNPIWDRFAAVGCVLVSAATAVRFTRGTYYDQDDFIFLRQARTKPINLAYFRANLFQHFSPLSRLGDLFVARYLPGQPTSAHYLAVALFVGCVAAFAWTITALTGRVWWRHLLTLAFGESLATVHLLGWWTAALNILPATLFGLLTIGCYLRYRKQGTKRWALLSVAAYAVSLGAHEQSWLVFGYLLLFEVLILSVGRGWRTALGRLREAWVLWLAYLALTVAALASYFEFYYSQVRPRPTAAQLVQFVGVLYGQALAPSIVGYRPLSNGVVSTPTAITDGAIVAAFIVVTIVIARSAWRVWAVFAIGFLANAYMTGANRVGLYGPKFGRQMYYVESPAWLFLLCAGAAVSLCCVLRSTGPSEMRAGWAHLRVTDRTPSALAVGSRRSIGLAAAGAVIVGVLAYQLVYLRSAHSLESQESNEVQAHASKLYFAGIERGVDAAGRRGDVPSVLDGPVPAFVVFPSFAPYNQLSSTLAVLGAGVTVNRAGSETFAVSQTGSLIHAGFVTLDPPGLQQPGATNVTVGLGIQTPASASPCYVAAPSGTVGIHIGLVHSAPTTWVKLRLTTTGAGTVFVSVTGPAGGAQLGTISLQSRPGTAAYVVPTGSISTFDTVVLGLQEGERVCVASVDVGTFAPLP
jgi:hypothetical protein